MGILRSRAAIRALEMVKRNVQRTEDVDICLFVFPL